MLIFPGVRFFDATRPLILYRIDVHVMLAAHNARERSVQQYARLFKAASSGFSLAEVYGQGVGVHHTLVVFEYKKH